VLTPSALFCERYCSFVTVQEGFVSDWANSVVLLVVEAAVAYRYRKIVLA
jgi:hypothetical protein